MKRFLLSILIVFAVLDVRAQTKLFITKTDGTVDSVMLSQVKTISFSGPTASPQLSLTGNWDVKAVYWGKPDVTGVLAINDANGVITGNLVLSRVIPMNGSATLSGNVTLSGKEPISGYWYYVNGTVNSARNQISGTYSEQFGLTYTMVATKR
jgi:hypothetical protein